MGHLKIRQFVNNRRWDVGLCNFFQTRRTCVEIANGVIGKELFRVCELLYYGSTVKMQSMCALFGNIIQSECIGPSRLSSDLASIAAWLILHQKGIKPSI